MDLTQLESLARLLLEYAQDGNWRAFAALALTSVVWALRTYALHPALDGIPYLGRVTSWLKTDRGGVVLVLVVGVLGGLGTALGAAQPVTLALVGSGIVNALMAAGLFSVLKRFFTPADKPGTAFELPERTPGGKHPISGR